MSRISAICPQKTGFAAGCRPASRSTARCRSGFTLVELLIVVAVILILAGITFGISRGVQNAQARAEAKAELAVLAQALEQFKSRYGDYPWHDSDGGYPNSNEVDETNTMLLYALTGRMVMERDNGSVEVRKVNNDMDNAQVEANPKFIDPSKLSTRDLNNDGSPDALVDPWGNPYKYWYKWEDTPDDWDVFGYHLYSVGPDGKDDPGGIEGEGVLPDNYRERNKNVDNIFVSE